MSMRVYIDIETGGVNMWKDAIIQIAAVCPETGLEFERKIQFIEEKANPEALAVNCYDRAVWEREAIAPKRCALELSEYLKRHACIEMVSKRTGNPYAVAQLVAYNGAKFDGPWLAQWFKRLGVFMPATYKILDPLQLAMWCLPDLENHKLPTLAEHFGIIPEEAHDALSDVKTMIAVTQRLESMMKPLHQLTDEQRMELFSGYCMYCGTPNLPCFCMNDE